ncbi:MAG: DUF4440 domain-containing protein [Ilumatobacteraceae bacterium]
MADRSFDEFLVTTRPKAAAAFVCGDPGPVTAISTRHDPATFFGPGGGHVSGAKTVIDTNESSATMFRSGGETHLEVLHSSHDGALAYWVGLQHATVHISGRDEPVPMTLRITELFRHDENGWQLIHRHADQHAEPDRG